MVQFSSDHLRRFHCCHVWDREDRELQLSNIHLLNYEGEHLQPHVIERNFSILQYNKQHFFLENTKDKGFSSAVGLPIDNTIIGTDVIDSNFSAFPVGTTGLRAMSFSDG